MTMEPYNPSSPSSATSTSNSMSSPTQPFHLTASNFFNSPLSSLLEYSGVFQAHPHYNPLYSPPARVDNPISGASSPRSNARNSSSSSSSGEVSIQIIGDLEENHVASATEASGDQEVVHSVLRTASDASSPSGGVDVETDLTNDQSVREGDPPAVNASRNVQPSDADASNRNTDSPHQRYDIQQAARWIEQVLPFSLLLLLVFIRQHLQGFILTIWVAAFMFKSNDILRKQTALKGERKNTTLSGISFLFTLHLITIYWWYWSDLFYSLIMIPPNDIPPFWNAIFIIMVNDTLVRQAAMILKCFILMYYRNSTGRNYRKQGQMLTLVEYSLLLYRALLPAPVWYRFFLNKEYGNLFSSLITGLYLTFKLTSIVEKVQYFFSSVKALSRTEIQYGTYATSEQVSEAGDLCAICQEKMLAPILLRCKHIFCEDCVSEWFERERTCPLCRALVKPADLRSFGDGSTSLFFQLF